MVSDTCTVTAHEQLGDIEDVIMAGDASQIARLVSSPNVTLRVKRRLPATRANLDDIQLDSFVPGTKKVYIKTWGCSHNNSDSEYMAGILSTVGYQILTKDGDDKLADVWILNSCTVKNPAEDHFKNYIINGQNLGKKIIVSGCVSQSSSRDDYLKNLSIIGVQQIDRVIEVVEETLKGNTIKFLGVKKDSETRKKLGGASLNLPKIRRNPLIEIIAISTGCLNQCTYCKTKHARGDLGSYSIQEIVERAKESFKQGVKEIWLTSEDSGAYGIDIGTDLPSLLNELIKVIPDKCKLRIGMTNPPYILNHLESMAKIYQSDKIYKFLHIPIQSGSDNVLQDMKREYVRSDFEQIVDYLKQSVPGINIATDIICGFPTESNDDFEETFSLVEKYRFPSLFINQFYPRPGTPAANMKRISTKIVKSRSRKVSELFNSFDPYHDRLDKVYEILVTEESTDKKFWVGHNQFYEQVLVAKSKVNLGETITVKIIATNRWSMIGEPVLSRSKSMLSKDNVIGKFLTSGKNYLPNPSWGTIWVTSCCFILSFAVIKKITRS